MWHACFLIGSSFGKQLLGLRHNLVNVANLMRNGLRKYSTQEHKRKIITHHVEYTLGQVVSNDHWSYFPARISWKNFNSNFTICKFIRQISPFPHLESGYGLRNGDELLSG